MRTASELRDEKARSSARDVSRCAANGKDTVQPERTRGLIFGRRDFDMVQGEVTPTVAGVCDPRLATTAGLRVASHNSVPIGARAEIPGVTQTRSLLNHAATSIAIASP
jgi:hypothetical protein